MDKREKCNHPNCINGGIPANNDLSECWLDSGDDPRVFCSKQCKNDYLKNLKSIKELDNTIQSLYTRKSRYNSELAKTMHILLGKKNTLEEIKWAINVLDLSSKYIKR